MIDKAGNSAAVNLVGITSSEQVYKIALSLFSGINLSEVRLIYFITDEVGVGQFTINQFPPAPVLAEVSPDATLTVDDIEDLEGSPFLTLLSSDGDASSNVTDLGRGAEFTFDTGSGGFAGGGFSYDDFSTGPLESADLSGVTDLILGVKGDVSELKLEIIDINDNKAAVKLVNISPTSEGVYKISMSLFAGVDLTKTRLIYFIAETGAGKFEVNQFPPAPVVPELAPDTTLSTSDIKTIPGAFFSGVISSGGGATASTVNSERGLDITFNTSTSGFAGGGFSYDNFATVGNIESFDFSGETEVVFGLKGPISELKLEFIDKNDNKNAVKLTGILPDTEGIYRIPLLFFPDIDLTQLRLIYFVAELPNQSGTFTVNHFPALSPTSLNPSELTDDLNSKIGGAANPVTVAPAEATVTSTATTRGLQIDYQTNEGFFGGGGYDFDDFSTSGTVESADLSAISDLKFSIQGDVSKLKLELLDATGKKVAIPVLGIQSGVENVYVLPMALLQELDLTQIRLMYFIIEGQNQTGTININFQTP
jgi:hypothetical protein